MAMTGFDLFIVIMAGVTVAGAIAVVSFAVGWVYFQGRKSRPHRHSH